ncbi:RidA family protein [Thermaurantiacus tibetensis]|uniref:RidA family protein n=1 Tax=Thermaurantiacus tibetensis TaxID=2759035 RepID=UPI00188F058A|nr:RidA family protein [Thermaurantiacus tibetensis]
MDAVRIATDPDPFAPFRIAQGYRVGDLVFLSGQAALDAAGRVVGVGDFDAQAEQTRENLAQVLGAAGCGFDQVVKVTIFLTDMGHFPKVLALRARWFRPPWPADTIVEVARLALPGLLLEVEAIAVVGGRRVDPR